MLSASKCGNSAGAIVEHVSFTIKDPATELRTLSVSQAQCEAGHAGAVDPGQESLGVWHPLLSTSSWAQYTLWSSPHGPHAAWMSS